MNGLCKNNIKISFRRTKSSLCRRAKPILCLLLSLLMLNIPLTGSTTTTVPTAEEMYNQLSTTYNSCITLDRSRYGLGRYVSGRWMFGCAHLVNMKLMVLGVNNRYVGADGKDEYDNYKNLGYDTTGKLYNNKYKIHVYPASKYTVGSALQAIQKECPVATNIIVGFERTNDTAGKIYGHAFYIEGLINGNVYFTENFNIAYYNEMYFQAGDPVVMTVSQCQAYYGRSWFTFEGVIWFEDPSLTAAANEGGSYEPGEDDSGYTVNTATAGTYTVVNAGTAGLNLRAGPGTNYDSLGRVPNGTTLYVTGTYNGFARVYYSDSKYSLDGWVSTNYLKKKSAMPKLLADYYDAEGYHIARRGYSTLADAVNAAPIGDVITLTLYSDITVTDDITVPEGITVDSAKHKITLGSGGSLLVRGGTVVASEEISTLASDPFTLCEQTDGQYIYRCYFGLKISGASLELSDKTAINFTVAYTSTMMPESSQAEYKLVCKNIAGTDATYTATPVSSETDGSENDYLSFRTDGFSAKYLADDITCYAEITVTVGDKKYTFSSEPLVYSAVDYCMSAKGDSLKLDTLLDSLLHYGAEIQKYFNYSTNVLADATVDAVSAATAEEIAGIALKHNVPPFSGSETSVHVDSARLVISDGIAIAVGTDGELPLGTRLLVWSAADYKALESSAESQNKDVEELLDRDSATYSVAPDENGDFTLQGVSPKMFADTCYFRLCVPAGAVYMYDYVVSYSVTSYCSTYLQNGKDDAIDPLCLAICRLCAAARDYYGYEVN